MKTKQLSLGRTLNVGDYESVRFDITIELDPDEDETKAFKALQKEVDARETALRREYKNK
jgi:hypothetical protein